jgi:hypothetical protein
VAALNTGTGHDLEKAFLAPAPAWAGLGEALWMLAAIGIEIVEPGEVREKAIAAADKALELDETLADAHKARAVIAVDGEWDIAKAQRQLRKGPRASA